MADKKRVQTASWLMGISLCIAGSSAIAADPPRAIDPALKRYLDCVNTSAKQQQAEKSDKITSAQSVLTSCEDAKQALLKARPDAGTRKIVAGIEQHLKSREKPR